MLDTYFVILLTLLRSYYHSLTQGSEKLRILLQKTIVVDRIEIQSGVYYSKVYVLARKGTKLPIWTE